MSEKEKEWYCYPGIPGTQDPGPADERIGLDLGGEKSVKVEITTTVRVAENDLD